MRTGKIVSENGKVEITEYTLHGKLITHLTKRTVDENGDETSQELHFFYDAQSKPAFVEFEGEEYRYIHNLQGDIVAIVDTTGNIVVEYKYDAWGKLIYETDNRLGALNPFRYRGYVWDRETDQYYLRSRYYSCDFVRFVIPDIIYVHNLYAYCYGRPTVYSDSSGFMPVSALNTISGMYNSGTLSASSVSAITMVLNGKNIYTAFHEIAQLNVAKQLYSMGYIAELEYSVPGVGEADIVAGTFIWEVKPSGASAGDQPGKYILATGYSAGFDMQTITDIPIIGKVRMKIESSGKGVLHYSFYEDNKSKKSTDVKKMVSSVLFWAAAAAAVIIGATLAEDVLTGGTGLTNDVASIGLAGAAASAILGI